MKKNSKKLELHRETLRQLELRAVLGGTDRAWTGCLSDCTECGGFTQVQDAQ